MVILSLSSYFSSPLRQQEFTAATEPHNSGGVKVYKHHHCVSLCMAAATIETATASFKDGDGRGFGDESSFNVALPLFDYLSLRFILSISLSFSHSLPQMVSATAAVVEGDGVKGDVGSGWKV
ncbi:hypothetical protein PIB30_001353 [Stylosanthes scabra]|uniref:Uncharacterized protein n=1 Tax=Stylosanthes scabra TaxID=79078 RepID=A0ABU6Y1N0_9FABA|nr:hypothetical protein [Stylosanthes scabra]